MTPPDAGTIDWNQVALWAGGIGTMLGTMGAAVWLAIRRVVQVAASAPASTITREETRVVTTDSVAMHEVAAAVEAVNVTCREILAVLKGEIAANRQERDERNKEEEKEQLKRELLEDLRREGELSGRRPVRKAD